MCDHDVSGCTFSELGSKASIITPLLSVVYVCVCVYMTVSNVVRNTERVTNSMC